MPRVRHAREEDVDLADRKDALQTAEDDVLDGESLDLHYMELLCTWLHS